MKLELSSEFASAVKGKNLYCGFSGGADSLTLLQLLKDAEEVFLFHLHAVHFEHGLRGRASVEDSEFCQKICAELNIPFTCVPLNVPGNMLPGEGIEAAARRMRLNYWKQLPENSIVALGHNADDLTENLFLRLMRGSNVSALTSLSEVVECEGVTIIRPLLRYSRTSIENFLQGRGLQWRNDATNAESDYGRNFLRNKILPELYAKFPYGKEGINRSLKNLLFDAQYIDNQAETVYNDINPLLRENWLKLPPAIFCRVFRLFLSEKIGKNVIAGHQLLTRFENVINDPPGQGFSELIITDYPDYSLYIDKTNILFVNHKKMEDFVWDPGISPVIKFAGFTFKFTFNASGKGDGVNFSVFDNSLLESFPLILRQVRAGDKMTAFGRKTAESVKKYLSEANIPAPLRESYPVLCDSSGEIIWIPGVKRSHKYPARNSGFFSISVNLN